MEVGSRKFGFSDGRTSLKSLGSDKVVLLTIFSLAAIPRIFVWWADIALSNSDYDDYREHGAELFATGTISDPHIMPGYAVLTQIFGEKFGVILLDVGLSSLTCILVWWLAEHLFKNRLAAALCGIAAAFHPNLILTAASGLTEPSFTFFFLAALALFYREKYVAGSVLLIVSILIRPSFDFLAPGLVFIFAVITHGRSWKYGLQKVGLYAACYVVLMAPWWTHNLNQYDTFVRLNLADGFVFYLGNNPHSQTGEGAATDIAPNDSLLTITDPLARNSAMKRAAFRFVYDQPGRFFELSTTRFLRFWHVEPGSNLTVYLLIHPFTFAFFCFLIFGFRRRWRETLPIVLCTIYLASVHTALISTPRYQLPILPIVILLGIAWTTVTLRVSALRRIPH